MNLRLGITEEPRCETCNVGLSGRIYLQKCCYHRFCSAECRHIFVTTRRVEAFTVDGSKLAKSIAKKSVQTQRSSGALTARIKQTLATKRATGQCIPEDQVPAYQAYRNRVKSVTKKQPIRLLENIEKRGPANVDGWHLDHAYSVKQGFLNDVSPEIIGHICNLRMIPAKDNIIKKEGCSITLTELLRQIESHRSCQPGSPTKPCDHLLDRH